MQYNTNDYSHLPLMPTELVERLIDYVPRRCGDDDSCKLWTKAVGECLHSIAKQSGLEMFPNVEAARGQFLLDFLLFKDGYGTVLAAESEWLEPASEIIADFEKLVHFKAPYKLMIFCSNQLDETSESLQTAFKKELLNHSQYSLGERYIFLDFKRGDFALAYMLEIDSERQLKSNFDFHTLREKAPFSRFAPA